MTALAPAPGLAAAAQLIAATVVLIRRRPA